MMSSEEDMLYASLLYFLLFSFYYCWSIEVVRSMWRRRREKVRRRLSSLPIYSCIALQVL